MEAARWRAGREEPGLNSKEFNIERYYRDAPLLDRVGTNELQRIIIARELVKRNPA